MVWERCSLRGFVVNERIVNVDDDLVVDDDVFVVVVVPCQWDMYQNTI